MAFETSSLPIPGTVLVAALLYGAASICAGQLVADRLIAKSGWHEACAEGLKAAARPAARKQSRVPEMRCSDTVRLLGREFQALCHEFGNPDFNAQACAIEEEAAAKQTAIETKRYQRAAAAAGSQCACAAKVLKSDKMFALGLYAGTARQVDWGIIEPLRLNLQQSLATPQCQALGPGA